MTKPAPIPCSVPGVIALATVTRYDGRTIERRRYTAEGTGLSLGARRGGALHMAGADTWEIFTIAPNGIPYGEPVGWVDEATLESALRGLAAWTPGSQPTSSSTERPPGSEPGGFVLPEVLDTQPVRSNVSGEGGERPPEPEEEPR